MTAAIKAGFAYFAVIFAAGVVFGSARIFFLIRLIGETGAVLAELPVMLAISWLVCGWLLHRFPVPPTWRARLTMGALAFCLLMAAELSLSVFVFGPSVAEHLNSYRSLLRALGLIARITFAFFPLLRRGDMNHGAGKTRRGSAGTQG